jgi:glycosyltransferase involved in cell wall biosynthesis
MENCMRVALLSVGLGRIRRGFERYFGDLFEILEPTMDITVFQTGGAPQSNRRIPSLFGPAAAIAGVLPLGRAGGGSEYRAYKNDCLAFGLSLLPSFRGERFDVIHCIDPPLIKVLLKLKQTAGFPGTLLFTNGCLTPAKYFPPVHVHQVAQVAFDEACAEGVPDSRMTYVPCGFYPERFQAPASREDLRRRHNIPPDTFVALAVTAVKRMHKRVDHLIGEFERVPQRNLLLWIDGNPEDASLAEAARRSLGDRVRITHLPSASVPELYGLADILVHTSLEESFGLAIVEAMSTGLLPVVHDSTHFRWLTGGLGEFVPMDAPGALADAVSRLADAGPQPPAARVARARCASSRFDWKRIAADYRAMYQKVAEQPA